MTDDMRTYYLRSTDGPALVDLMVRLGAVADVDGQLVVTGPGCWDPIGPIGEWAGQVDDDGAPVLQPLADDAGRPYWHANLLTAIDLAAAAARLGLLDALRAVARLDADGEPIPPAAPRRVFA